MPALYGVWLFFAAKSDGMPLLLVPLLLHGCQDTLNGVWLSLAARKATVCHRCRLQPKLYILSVSARS